MKGQGPKITEKAWRKFTLLGQERRTIKLSELAADLGLATQETLTFLQDVFPVGIGAEVFEKDEETWVKIEPEALHYLIPLAPAEWVELQHILSLSEQATSNKTVFSSLQKKVSEHGPIKVVMELLNQLELWDQQCSEKHQAIIKVLDAAVNEKQLVQMTTVENKTYCVYPCRVIHLEGKLSLIAEDSHDHCLTVISIQELEKAEHVPSTSAPRVSLFEVEEFIGAIRSMNEKETRLILKIHDHQSVNLFPDHQFLGKPCMITNPNGELIWAAYVEPCEALFDWLMGLGRNVEILDPVKFKQDYLSYCEEKLSNKA